MLLSNFSSLSSITEVISDALFGIVLLLGGLFLLLTPYDKIQKVLPNALSKKATKVCGVLVIICAVGCIALLILI